MIGSPSMSPLDDIISDLAATLAKNHANWVEQMMRLVSGTTTKDPKEINARGLIIKHPDGREVFCWDGIPRLELWPMTVSNQDGKMVISQKYRDLNDARSVKL